MRVIPHNRPTIGKEEIDAAVNALSNLELTTGTKVLEFEERFAIFAGIDSIATSSGTAALHLALIAMGIGRGDEVILPSYTCAAVAYPILYQQAKSVLVDAGSDYNISVEEIKNSISSKTKAVIVPHMFGYPADICEIGELCDEKGIFLIEDCAQSIGAEYGGKKVGTFGDISIFSFYSTKIITSIQGGMLSTDNKEWIEQIKDIRYYDQPCSLDDMRIKYSYMMSDVSAAIGIGQLKKLDSFIKRRREIARIYRNEIPDVEHPAEVEHKKHVYSRYVIKTEFKDKIIKELEGKNIICRTMYSPPLHERALFASPYRQYPQIDNFIGRSLSLPIYPSISDKEIHYMIDTFNRIRANLC